MLIWNILIIFLLSMMPFVELRLAIPVGILKGETTIFGLTIVGMGMHPLLVLLIAIVGNILIGLILYRVLHFANNYVRKSFLSARYIRTMDKAKRKVEPYVKRYGVFGLALFISLPIPGSGVYMGSLGAFVLGFSRKAHKQACIIGVIIAGLIVTALTTGIDALVRVF